MKETATTLALLFLAGCAGPAHWQQRQQRLGLVPMPEQVSAADYGGLPAGWRRLAREAVRLYGAHDFVYFPPRRYWAYVARHQFVYGWRVSFDVTAQNVLGGLSRDTIQVLIHDGRVVATRTGNLWERYR